MSNDFVNWYSTKNVKSRLYWAFEGIAFDIRNNAFWHADWGKKPESLAAVSYTHLRAHEA